MKVTLVRFSRPLLIVNGADKYQVIYGFVVDDPEKKNLFNKLRNYVGYLACLSDFTNGGDFFSISFDRNGTPDLIDKNGLLHIKNDSWTERMGRRCVEKLKLSYYIISAYVDEDVLYDCMNPDNLIVDENLFYELEEYVDSRVNEEYPF